MRRFLIVYTIKSLSPHIAAEISTSIIALLDYLQVIKLSRPQVITQEFLT